MELPACFVDIESREIIEVLCKKNGIDIRLLEELIDTMQGFSGLRTKEGVTFNINEIIDSFIKRSTKDQSN
ncbi:MAG: hypothetical protein EXR06_04125 [Rickettsiales bacterium]|nr:hypothetical protein [Rickettsiales bacterium]